MDCRTFNRNLEDYLEDGLDFAGRFGMERHAQQCFGCGKTVADAQRLRQMARGISRVNAPADFEAMVLRRIRDEGLSHPARRLRLIPFFPPERVSWRAIAVGVSALMLVGVALVIATSVLRTDSGGDPALVSLPQRDAPASQISTSNDVAAMTDKSGPAGVTVPGADPGRRIMAGYSTEEEPPVVFRESSDSEYIECLVPGPGGRQYIMRLPRTIRTRYGQPSEEYFIRNVSH